jgi:hypothetical protein
MAPQPSSLRTSFRALSITRIEIKESVILLHGGRRHGFVEWEGQNQPEIELNEATDKLHKICSMVIQFNQSNNALGLSSLFC